MDFFSNLFFILRNKKINGRILKHIDQGKMIPLSTLHSVSFSDLQVVVNKHLLEALLLINIQ